MRKIDQIAGASARINQVSVEQARGGHVANGQTRPSFARAVRMGAVHQVDVMHGELPWCEFQTDCVFWINPRKQPEASSLLEDLGIAAAWIRPDRYMGATTKSMPELYKRLPKFLKTNEEYGDYNETSIS